LEEENELTLFHDLVNKEIIKEDEKVLILDQNEMTIDNEDLEVFDCLEHATI